VGLGGINASNVVDFLAILLVFLFVDIFDTIGTLMGVGTQAGYIDEHGELPRANRALSADAIATTAGAIMGLVRRLEGSYCDSGAFTTEMSGSGSPSEGKVIGAAEKTTARLPSSFSKYFDPRR